MSISRSWGAATTYFGLVFGAGFILGAIRVTLVVPHLGVRVSELLEMPLMLAVTYWAARFVVRRHVLAPTLAVRLPIGCLALALLVFAELAVIYLLQQQTLREYLAGRDVVSGSVYVAMLGLFGLMPLLVLRGSDSSLAQARER